MSDLTNVEGVVWEERQVDGAVCAKAHSGGQWGTYEELKGPCGWSSEGVRGNMVKDEAGKETWELSMWGLFILLRSLDFGSHGQPLNCFQQSMV